MEREIAETILHLTSSAEQVVREYSLRKERAQSANEPVRRSEGKEETERAKYAAALRSQQVAEWRFYCEETGLYDSHWKYVSLCVRRRRGGGVQQVGR